MGFRLNSLTALVCLGFAAVVGCAASEDGTEPSSGGSTAHAGHGGASGGAGGSSSGSGGVNTAGTAPVGGFGGVSAGAGGVSAGAGGVSAGAGGVSAGAGGVSAGSGGASAGSGGASAGAGGVSAGAGGASAGSGGASAGAGGVSAGAGGVSAGSGGASAGSGGASAGSGGASAGSGGAGGSSGSAGTGGSAGSGGGASCTDGMKDGLEALKDCGGPKCDACVLVLDRYVIGSGSSKGTVSPTWDASALHFSFSILDNTPFNDSTNNWEDDAVEIYLDLKDDKSTSFQSDDFQIVVPRSTDALSGEGSVNYASITVTRAEVAGGYTLDVSIPWAALGGSSSAIGKTIGLDVAVDDDTNGGTRDAQTMLFGSINDFTDTSGYGDVSLN